MRHYSEQLRDLDDMIVNALTTGDIDTVKGTLYRAIVFAGFTANAQTAEAERSYDQWVNGGGVGEYGRTRRTRLVASAQAWIESLSLDDLRDLYGKPWALAEAAAVNVHGLSIVKGSFAAALAGCPEAYCLDIHSLTHAVDILGLTDDRPYRYADKIRSGLFRRADGWFHYRRIGDAAFGNRNNQWDFFYGINQTFRESQHRVYFVSVGMKP